MAQKAKTRRLASRAKKMTTPIHPPDMRQAWVLMQSLTCELIKKLDSVLKAQDALGEGWERLFGAKDSTVINLQKLVGVLAEISDRLVYDGNVQSAGALQRTEPLQAEDLAMLQRWLTQELADIERLSV